MSKATVQEWTLDGVLDPLGRINHGMLDRQFVFILGAGAVRQIRYTQRESIGRKMVA